jgi:hypothetical protein
VKLVDIAEKKLAEKDVVANTGEYTPAVSEWKVHERSRGLINRKAGLMRTVQVENPEQMPPIGCS